MKVVKRLLGELALGFAKVDNNILKNSEKSITNGIGLTIDKDMEVNDQIKKFAEKHRFSMYKVLEKLENGDNFNLTDIENFSIFKPIKSETIKNIVGDKEDIQFIAYNYITDTDEEYTTKVVEDKIYLDKIHFKDHYKLKIYYDFLPKYNISKYLNKICLRKDNDKLILDFYINDYKDIYDKVKVTLNNRLDSMVDLFLVEDFLEVKEIEFNSNKDIGIKNLTNVQIKNLIPKKVFKKVLEGKKNGFYVISYELNNDDIKYEYLPLKYYIEEAELTKKYLNKEKRDE